MVGYNPYRNLIDNNKNTNVNNKLLANKSLLNISSYTRNYGIYAIKNATLLHTNEDPRGFEYDNIRSKINALSTENQNLASLNPDYAYKLQLFKQYAREPEINHYVSKLANEIITYSKQKMFCKLIRLNSEKYSESVIQRAESLFLEFYAKLNFYDKSKAYDLCFDYLVEGYICKEIVYDDKRKNIIFFQTVDPTSIISIIDEETGIKLWIQNYQSGDPRIILDSDLIYIAYAGSSKYTDTSYIEPMIRPYNEIKNLERIRILFNLQNATRHKSISVPMGDIPRSKQEQELLALMSMVNDSIEFDSYEGHVYINGTKDIPYSKTNWFVDNGGSKVDVKTEGFEGVDLNEDVVLNWFRNNFKQSTRFPMNKLDNTTGGGTIYNFGSDVTFDDFNFDQFVDLLRTQFQDILIKPIYVQLCLEFPELIDSNILNDLDLEFFGNDEIIKAKQLSNLQAKINIANDILNFKDIDGEKSYLHPKLIAEDILELPKDLLEKNTIYWKKYGGTGEAGEAGGGMDFGGGDDFGGDDFGGDDFGGDDIADDLGDDIGGDDIGGDEPIE